jgi:hypothetical protein
MNIFVVQSSPHDAAHDLCDKHVVKMIVESVQMLSTAHRVLDGEPAIRISKSGRKIKHWVHPKYDNRLCLATMVNHPCTRWAMETSCNYDWLWQHASSLMFEYTNRYQKKHSMHDLMGVLVSCPENIKVGSLTPFAQAMPEQYKCKDAVTAYRNYYIGEKKRFAKWAKTPVPSWFANEVG